MPPTVIDLREFYHTPLGLFARQILRSRIQKIWPRIDGEKLAAIGYATPLLRPWIGKAERIIALMPRDQGAIYWPTKGQNITCFAELEALPIDDESMDRVIVMHALESAQAPDALLHEIWRILKNNGRAIFIVPNRRGFWAHHDENPFGTGRPYSGTQLKNLVKDHGFTSITCMRCLYMPPWPNKFAVRLSETIEKIGRILWGKFGGVLVLEIEKQVIAPLMVKTTQRSRSPLFPFTIPLPTSRIGYLERLLTSIKKQENRKKTVK